MVAISAEVHIMLCKIRLQLINFKINVFVKATNPSFMNS